MWFVQIWIYASKIFISLSYIHLIVKMFRLWKSFFENFTLESGGGSFPEEIFWEHRPFCNGFCRKKMLYLAMKMFSAAKKGSLLHVSKDKLQKTLVKACRQGTAAAAICTTCSSMIIRAWVMLFKKNRLFLAAETKKHPISILWRLHCVPTAVNVAKNIASLFRDGFSILVPLFCVESNRFWWFEFEWCCYRNQPLTQFEFDIQNWWKHQKITLTLTTRACLIFGQSKICCKKSGGRNEFSSPVGGGGRGKFLFIPEMSKFCQNKNNIWQLPAAFCQKL